MELKEGLKTSPEPEKVGEALVWKTIPDAIELSPEFARNFFYGVENSGVGFEFTPAYEVELSPDWEDEGFRIKPVDKPPSAYLPEKVEKAEGVLFPDKLVVSPSFLEELNIASKNTLLLQSPLGKALPSVVREALAKRKFTVSGYEAPWSLEGYFPENSAVATMTLRAFVVERNSTNEGFKEALAEALRDKRFWKRWKNLVKIAVEALKHKKGMRIGLFLQAE